MKTIFCCFLALLFFIPARAQNSKISLDEARQRVTDNYELIEQARLEFKAGRTENNLGRAGYLPVVELNGGVTQTWLTFRNRFATGDEISGQNLRNFQGTVAITATYNLFSGFYRTAQMNQLRLKETGALFNLQETTNRVLFDFSQLYSMLYAQQEWLEVYQEQLEVSLKRYELLQKQLEVGAADRLEYLQAKTDLQADSVGYEEAWNELQLLWADFVIYTKLPEWPPYQLESPLQLEGLLSGANRADSLVQKNPAIRESETQLQQTQREIQMARSNYMPRLDVVGGYDFMYQQNEGGFFLFNRSLGPFVGLRLSYNLFNSLNDRTEVQLAEVRQNIQSKEVDLTKQSLRNQYNAAYREVENLAKRIAIEERAVKNGEDNLELATMKFELGEITLLTYRDIQLNLMQTKFRLLQFKKQWFDRMTYLKYLEGELM